MIPADGVAVVWDLREGLGKFICAEEGITSTSSVVLWNPDNGTQFINASSDSGGPAIRLWDLRKPTAPVARVAPHGTGGGGGVLAAGWSSGPRLTTAGSDGRLLLCDMTRASDTNPCIVKEYVPPDGIAAAAFGSGSFDGMTAVVSTSGSLSVLSLDDPPAPSVSDTPASSATQATETPDEVATAVGANATSVEGAEIELRITGRANEMLELEFIDSEVRRIPLCFIPCCCDDDLIGSKDDRT